MDIRINQSMSMVLPNKKLTKEKDQSISSQTLDTKPSSTNIRNLPMKQVKYVGLKC